MEDRRYLKDEEPPAQVGSQGGGGGIEVMAVEGPDKGKVLRTEQLPVLIGRAPDNDIHVPQDRKISRYHAKIVKARNRYFLEDLGSTNGTLYQGTQISGRVEISHGDLFVCGETTFRFTAKEQDLPQADTATVVAASPFLSAVFSTRLIEAIVVLDMCNSSALASQYGDEQAMKVRRELRRHYLPVAKRWKAQFVKNTGDGYLVTFAHAREAVGSSVEMLKHLQDYNAASSPSEQFRLRLGLHCGETMVDADGDRHGNAVNIAFRVQGVREEDLIEPALAGQLLRKEDRIYVTAPLQAELPPAAQSFCRAVGFFELKGIPGRHLVYEVLWEDVDFARLGP